MLNSDPLYIISGANGLLGTHIFQELEKEHASVVEIRVALNRQDNLARITQLAARHDDVIFIHCAARIWPKNDNDHVLNRDLPSQLVSVLDEIGKPFLFLFVSSTNAALTAFGDSYSTSKREAERQLTDPRVIIVRPDLLWGDFSRNQHVRRLKKLIFVMFGRKFMFYPGPGHIFCPLVPEGTARCIISLAEPHNRGRIFSILGKNPTHIFDLIRRDICPGVIIFDVSLGLCRLLPCFLKDWMLSVRLFQHLIYLDRSKAIREATGNAPCHEIIEI